MVVFKAIKDNTIDRVVLHGLAVADTADSEQCRDPDFLSSLRDYGRIGGTSSN